MGSKLISTSAVAFILLFASLSFAQNATQLRIVRPVDNRSVVRLQGSLVPRARAQFDRGAVPGDMPMQRMTLVFSRTAAQQSDLDQLLAAQQDPTSPNYHNWLTPEEFGDHFGLSQPDVNTIAAWLSAQGFAVDEISRSRTWIAFSGIAAQFEAAFHAPIHNFLVDGSMHYAPSTEPSIPEAFAGVVAAISGTHDFRPQPKSRMRRVNPQLTSSLSGNHFLAPGDFGTIYDLPDYANGVFQSGGNDGTGQSIAIVGQSQLVGSPNGPFTDIDTFRSVSNLPPTHLQTILVGPDPGLSTGDIEEANLDIQWSGAVAPNANIIFVYSKDALLTSLQNIVNNNLAPVISISYGECESKAASDINTIEGYLQQANAQGQTVSAAAGDVGATDCDGTSQVPVATATQGLAVDYPASSIYVTAMGGSEFTGDSTATPVNGVAPAQTYWNSSSDPNDTSASAFAYIPEAVWNDTVSTGTNVGTGGGASAHFGKPSWQIGNGVPQDGHRDVPDLALASSPGHDGYIVCSQGSCQTGYRRNSDQTFTVIGGTSAAVPSFAGIAALANQKLGVRQGNLNPQIYLLAASSQWAFNDITTGDNKTVCTVGTTGCTSSPIGFAAGPGYDLATGWGSVDASGFLNALAGQPAQPDFVLLPAQRTLSTSQGTAGPVSILISTRQGFSANVVLSCSMSSSLPGSSCNVQPATIAGGQSASLTVANSTDPTILGTQTGTVTIQGVSGSLTHTVAISATLNYPDFQIAAGNATEDVPLGGSTTDTVTLTALQSFAGSVSYSCTGPTGVTCSLSPNPITANPSSPVSSTLTLTASSTATSGSITITATSGSLSHTLQIPVNTTNPDFILTVASPVVSIPSGGTITDNLTVTPAGGFNSDVALTCSVSSSLGTTTCSINPTTVTGGTGTALLTLQGAVLTRDRGVPLPFLHRGVGTYATFVFALGMVFTVKPQRRRRNSCVWRKGLFGLLLLCVMFGAVSCGGGGGGSSTPQGPTPLSGTVTVTGTSGGVSHTTSITVTIT